MADAERPIRLFAPTTEEEWGHADLLVAALKEWDVQQSQAFGFERAEVLALFYPAEIGDIRRDSVAPDGCFLLAMDAGLPAGCAAFRRLTSDVCELYDVYVRPTCRGRGIGSMLLQRLMSNAKGAGYRAMCLETATFMHDAHGLYRSLEFQVREPYRSIPDRFAKDTIWMERKLAG